MALLNYLHLIRKNSYPTQKYYFLKIFLKYLFKKIIPSPLSIKSTILASGKFFLYIKLVFWTAPFAATRNWPEVGKWKELKRLNFLSQELQQFFVILHQKFFARASFRRNQS